MRGGLKSEKDTIGDIEVTVTQFDVLESLELMPDVIPVFMPMFNVMAQANDPDANPMSVVLGISNVFKQLTPEKAKALPLKLLRKASAIYKDDKGMLIKVDLCSDAWITQVFGGDIVSLFKAMFLSVGVNYVSFFPVSAPSEKVEAAESSSISTPM